MYVDEIRAYTPQNEQEAADQRLILEYIRLFPDNILTRDNEIAHLSSSGFVVNADGTRVLIDGGKTFRDFIRANKDSQRLIKKLILQVSGKAIPIGPYEPRTAGKAVSNAEQSLHALEKLGLDVSIEDTARKQK